MKRNVGSRERVARLFVGAVAGVAAIMLPRARWWRLPLGILALAGLATGTTRYCPASEALGIDNSGENAAPSTPIPI